MDHVLHVLVRHVEDDLIVNDEHHPRGETGLIQLQQLHLKERCCSTLDHIIDECVLLARLGVLSTTGQWAVGVRDTFEMLSLDRKVEGVFLILTNTGERAVEEEHVRSHGLDVDTGRPRHLSETRTVDLRVAEVLDA